MAADDPPGAPAAGAPVSDRLQALLARAAQEQIVEQRQASAVLAELRGLVAGLEEQLRGAASAARLEEVAASVADLRREVDGLSGRIAGAAEDTERRLAAHVDDAVMALAEVLLRRRRGRPAEPAGPAVPRSDAGPAEQVETVQQGPLYPEEELDRALALDATPQVPPADEQPPAPHARVVPDQDVSGAVGGGDDVDDGDDGDEVGAGRRP